MMSHAMVRRFLGCATFLFGVSSALAAQPDAVPAEREQTAAVKASYEASRDGKWDAYALLIDPRDLVEFKQKLKPILERAPLNPTAPGHGLLDLLDGGQDLKTVTGWEPQEFFARLMRGTTSKTPFWQSQAGLKFQIIGFVSETPEQAHAVVRVEKSMGALKITRLEIVSLRRVAGADWKVSLPEELRGLAQTLSAAMSLPQPVESTTTRENAQPE